MGAHCVRIGRLWATTRVYFEMYSKLQNLLRALWWWCAPAVPLHARYVQLTKLGQFPPPPSLPPPREDGTDCMELRRVAELSMFCSVHQNCHCPNSFQCGILFRFRKRETLYEKKVVFLVRIESTLVLQVSPGLGATVISSVTAHPWFHYQKYVIIIKINLII